MESFLRHINKQVRQGEEQDNLMAAVQRIGPYEVLEPSSEEMEKVREGRGLRKGKVPRKMDVAEAWRGGGRGATAGRVHHSFSVIRVPGAEFKSRKRTKKHSLSLQAEEGWKEMVLVTEQRT